MPSKEASKRKATRPAELQSNGKRARRDERQALEAKEQTKSCEPETASEDDICPICHLLFYRPVTTKCKHTLCESCMAHWADASQTSAMTIVSLSDNEDDSSSSSSPHPNNLSARCPMCRTPTTASLNRKLHRSLRTRYPQLYLLRKAEEQPTSSDSSSTETLILYIGNTHRLRPRDPDDDYATSNIHEWTFFVRLVSPQHAHVIEEVQIFLHPSFRPPRIIRSMAPYEIRRVGWGIFTVTAHVILKAGYSWASGEAERAPDGADKGMLPLHWTLDFEGRGRQGKCRMKVKSEAWAEERMEEEERETERERARMRRAYERDGNWMPLAEE